MKKIWLIVKREYFTRVRKKSFIVMTILGPLLFAGLMIVPVWLMTLEGEEKTVQVLDESQLFYNKFNKVDNINFQYIDAPLAEAKQNLSSKEIYGILYIPKFELDSPQGITFFGQGNPSLTVLTSIEKTLATEIEDQRLTKSGIDKSVLEKIKTRVVVNTINLSELEEKRSDAGIATVIGYVGALLTYFLIFLYGAQVMRGVIEEKTNRIVEVIISSVKPFQLMAGKIIGIAAVGLTQFILWIFLTFAITSAISSYFQVDRFQSGQFQNTIENMDPEKVAQAQDINNILTVIESVDILYLAGCFVFYFLAGYLLYSSLFAAIGSAIENEADSQQFMFPVTIPLIISVIVLTAVLKEPDGKLAFWMSMIPLTSPVVMMMRLPFGVPFWQLALSMVLLAGGFIFTIWVASRIYRIGILMHGSKVSYKTMAKWFFMRN